MLCRMIGQVTLLRAPLPSRLNVPTLRCTIWGSDAGESGCHILPGIIVIISSADTSVTKSIIPMIVVNMKFFFMTDSFFTKCIVSQKILHSIPVICIYTQAMAFTRRGSLLIGNQRRIGIIYNCSIRVIFVVWLTISAYYYNRNWLTYALK